MFYSSTADEDEEGDEDEDEDEEDDSSEEDVDTGSPPPSLTVTNSSDHATDEMDTSESEWIVAENVQGHHNEDYNDNCRKTGRKKSDVCHLSVQVRLLIWQY